MNDKLGDRMKQYEAVEAQRRFMPLLPIVARLDGRSFSSFTKGLKRPYDPDFQSAMVETTRYLVEHTNACVGYTQSDEITLAWYSEDPKEQLWFGGRVGKMTSQLASHATLAFYRQVVEKLPPRYADLLPTFDARVWQVPNLTEAANVFIWREWDATKNSITMAAQEYYSHKELHGKSGEERLEMLFQKGVMWNNYDVHFKRGVYVQKTIIPRRQFTTEELESLPPKHHARTNPDLVVERSLVRVIDMPILSKVLNREGVLFKGEEPTTPATMNSEYMFSQFMVSHLSNRNISPDELPIIKGVKLKDKP